MNDLGDVFTLFSRGLEIVRRGEVELTENAPDARSG